MPHKMLDPHQAKPPSFFHLSMEFSVPAESESCGNLLAIMEQKIA